MSIIQIIRIVLGYIVMFRLGNIPFWVRVVLIHLIDGLDCPKGLLAKDSFMFDMCGSETYHLWEKIGDTVSYMFILWAVGIDKDLRPFFPIAFVLFFIRIFGVIHFYVYRDRNMFLYFPNHFTEQIILASFLIYVRFPLGCYVHLVSASILGIAKVYHEFHLHGRPPSRSQR